MWKHELLMCNMVLPHKNVDNHSKDIYSTFVPYIYIHIYIYIHGTKRWATGSWRCFFCLYVSVQEHKNTTKIYIRIIKIIIQKYWLCWFGCFGPAKTRNLSCTIQERNSQRLDWGNIASYQYLCTIEIVRGEATEQLYICRLRYHSYGI